MRGALAALLLIAAGSLPAASVTVRTRGQAELVARRHAIDAAVAELTVRADGLRVTPSLTLGDWMATHPREQEALDQALRDARLTVDEAREGQWHVRMEITVAEINEALGPALRRGLAEGDDLVIAGEGAAAIPWGHGAAEPSPPPPAPPPATGPQIPQIGGGN